jgi:hypothetical protein
MEKSLVNHEPEAMWKEIVVAWLDIQPAICPIRMDCPDLKPKTLSIQEGTIHSIAMFSVG